MCGSCSDKGCCALNAEASLATAASCSKAQVHADEVICNVLKSVGRVLVMLCGYVAACIWLHLSCVSHDIAIISGQGQP